MNNDGDILVSMKRLRMKLCFQDEYECEIGCLYDDYASPLFNTAISYFVPNLNEED